ncbi:phage baseplate protein [uncultured Paraglaciecola sp.]|uniref:phage baseplate protein n=1 Tax=uncultured Paraglaciecola sp. TaxID=1765024 RepID=UPI0026370BF7|nr:hypothetical protein [uncultured Paraglaciecola sp.]
MTITNLNDLNDGLQKYLVSPLSAFGIGGYVFDVANETIADIRSDITDHYTEANVAVQDHIGIKPKRISLRGFTGEVVFRPEGNEEGVAQTLTKKLVNVTSYLPALSSAAQQVQDVIQSGSIESVTLESASDIFGLVQNSLSGSGKAAQQQNVYRYFVALQEQGVLMGVQTPWEFLTNMAIEGITAVQAENSDLVSDFIVTFKQIRIAESTLATSSPRGASQQGDASVQGESETQNGSIQGKTLPDKSLPARIGNIGSVTDLSKITDVWSYGQ